MLFLASDQIWPSAINIAYPSARFVARARVAVDDVSIASAFVAHVTGDIWGVLIEVDGSSSGRDSVVAITDLGEERSADLVADELLSGDPESLYMASRYWELSPSYIQQLREAILQLGLDSADEEPRDDGALSQASTEQA